MFHVIPWIALGSIAFFIFFHLFFSGKIGLAGAHCASARSSERSGARQGAWQYGAVILLRAPLVIAGVIVVHPGFEAFRRRGHLRRDARVFASDFFRGCDAGTNALRRNSLSGLLVIPREAWPDGRLRTGDAQFLPFLQCRGRLAIFAASDSRGLRIASGTSSAATLR